MADALACTLLSYKTVPTRKVFQAVVELPIEQASQAIALFGQPDPDGATWLALARLAPTKSAPVAEPSEKPRLRSNLAAILCKENHDFRAWLRKECQKRLGYVIEQEPPDDLSAQDCANDMLKLVLDIQSKKELDTDPKAAERFDRLTTDFAYRNVTR